MKPTLRLFLLGVCLTLPAQGFAQTRPDAFDLLQRANNLLYDQKTQAYNTLPVNEIALGLARQALAQPAGSVRQLSREHFSHMVDLSPHIATEFVRESQIKASRNDWMSAMNARLDALELSIKLEAADRFGGRVGSIAGEIENVATKEIYAVASHLDAASSRTIAARLDAIETLRPNFLDLLEARRAENLRKVDEYLQKPDWKERIINESIAEHDLGALGSFAWGISVEELQNGAAPMLRNQVEKWWDIRLENERRPAATRPIPLGFKLQEAAAFLLEAPSESSRTEFLMARTQALLLSSALKLQAIHEEIGTYPTTFNTPADPFGNGTLIYWPIGKTYRLYSVGPDGKDNGATTSLSRFQARWPDDVIPPLLEPDFAQTTR
ncbi:MAG TPA: hypothetical protein VF627_10550 [Abditibacterium sp.]|jgi:hypothetical protein